VKLEPMIIWLQKIPVSILVIVSVLIVGMFGIIDHLTGYEISFSIFYLFPIIFATWLTNRTYGVLIAGLSAVTWMLADLTSGHVFSHWTIQIWNAFMRFGFYLIIVYALTAIRLLLEREKQLARTDYLTGALNNRAFYERADLEINRALRNNLMISLAYIDLDNFKQINDSLGHRAGDRLLQLVTRTIMEKVRANDALARLGGDEFVLLMPETDEFEAPIVIQRLHELLANKVSKTYPVVTFSIGVVTCYQPCGFDELISMADNLMYRVKEKGKNRVEYDVVKKTKFEKRRVREEK
jgi:diguanylate cyclase (GGDEF)-like protein